MFQYSSLSCSSSTDLAKTSAKASTIFGSQLRFSEIEQTHQRFSDSVKFRSNPTVRLMAFSESAAVTKELIQDKPKSTVVTEKASDHFKELRHRFLGFKKDKYLKNLEHYKILSEVQTPKSGPSETNAALEFAVNSLEVENILVIGHSCCGGIKALMSLPDEANPSFIKSWVSVGKPAKVKTKAAASNLDFDQQCRHCEKESVNSSLLNLLSYPWIEERVTKGTLALHGGYYDFIDCTFEKWTLDCKGGSNSMANGGISIKNRKFWA